MKLFFIYMILSIILLFWGMTFTNGFPGESSSLHGFKDKQDLSLRSSSSSQGQILVKAYSLMKEAFIPAKQVDIQDDNKNIPDNFYHKAFAVCGKAGSSRQIKIISGKNFTHLLAERYINGFYIYSFGQLII